MSRARLIFYLITFAAVVVIFLKFGELREIEKIFLGSNFYYLPIIIAIQLVSYVLLALNYRDVLIIKGLAVSVWKLFPITYVTQFISQAIPTGGLSGQVFFIFFLKRYGLTAFEGVGRAILEVLTLYVAYAAYFIAATILIFNTGIARSEPKIIYFILAFLMFLVICGVIFLLSQKRRGKQLPAWISRRFNGEHATYLSMAADQFRETLNLAFLCAHGKRFWLAVFWQVAHLFTHVLTLYTISFALGHPIGFVPCFIAFTFSKFLSMVSIVPGAPGVFEAAMTLILNAFGIPAAPALAATLLTRAFTFWLPMPIGWMLYNYYTRKWSEAVVK